MLASCQLELNDALQEIKKKDKLIEKLNNKLNRLSSATELARDKAREAKVYAKTVEQDSKKTTKKLKEEVAMAEKKLAQSQVIIDAEVDRVRTIEVVSLASLNSPCICCCAYMCFTILLGP